MREVGEEVRGRERQRGQDLGMHKAGTGDAKWENGGVLDYIVIKRR